MLDVKSLRCHINLAMVPMPRFESRVFFFREHKGSSLDVSGRCLHM